MEYFDYLNNTKISPFEKRNGNNYFACAGKISYLGSYEEIGNLLTPFDERNKIFKGEFVLLILKRYAVIKNGIVDYVNPNFDDGHIVGNSRYGNNKQYIIISSKYNQYKVKTWQNTYLKTYIIQDENDTLQPKKFKSIEDAIEYGKSITQNNNTICVVCQWFSDIDRH